MTAEFETARAQMVAALVARGRSPDEAARFAKSAETLALEVADLQNLQDRQSSSTVRDRRKPDLFSRLARALEKTENTAAGLALGISDAAARHDKAKRDTQLTDPIERARLNHFIAANSVARGPGTWPDRLRRWSDKSFDKRRTLTRWMWGELITRWVEETGERPRAYEQAPLFLFVLAVWKRSGRGRPRGSDFETYKQAFGDVQAFVTPMLCENGS